jgi:hypothetical protein
MFDNNVNDTHKDADTYDWDAAFAINFTHANDAIVINWPNVNEKAKHIVQAASDMPQFKVDGMFAPWQLIDGGDGKNIRLQCAFASGTYSYPNGSQDLVKGTAGKPMSVVIEVGMEWVPDPDQFAFVLDGSTAVTAAADLDKSLIDTNLQTAFANNKAPLSSGATAQVQKPTAEWLIIDGKNYYYILAQHDKYSNLFLNIYKFEDAWTNNLKILAGEAGGSVPAVSVVTIANNPLSGIPADVFPSLLSDWFNVNIGEFNHVFGTLDLAPQVAKDAKYAFIKPTATSYAVTDEGTLDSSVFGVLSMGLQDIPTANHQVSPFAIPSGADANGADAGFLISGPMFLSQMMLAGARQIFNGAAASNFLITNDGLTITNINELVWGKFMLDDKKKGSLSQSYTNSLDQGTISSDLRAGLQRLNIYLSQSYKAEVTTKGSQWLLTTGGDSSDEYILSLNNNAIDVYLATVIKIGKSNFKMSLVHSYVEVEFIDLNYSYTPDFDVHCNYTEQIQLGLKDQSGKKIFWYNQIERDLVVSVTKTQSAITREIVEGAITAVLALVAVLGPIIEGLSAGAEITGVTEEEGTAIVSETAFREAEEANPAAFEENEAAAATSAAEQSGGKLTNIKNAFNTPKWKFVGSLAAVAGAVAGLDTAIDAIIEAAATNKWENVPGFDNFAQQAIQPFSFPNVDSFDLVSAWLAGSLQIGLKTKTKAAAPAR